MSVRKALGILVFSTQAVVVFDYNMQSRNAGLAPGALSMKDYAAIVQKRYETPDSGRFAGLDVITEPDTPSSGRPRTSTLDSSLASTSGSAQGSTGAAQAASSDAPTAVCIRRGTALYCQ
jgi:hypothetical protein